MKVYLVYVPEDNTYSYDGYSHEVQEVFLDESKAKEYVVQLNKSIRDKREYAYVVPLNTKD